MLMGTTVSILFRQTKVNDIYEVAFLSKAHEKIVRLDISVDKVLRVNVFYTTNLQKQDANTD